MWHVISKVTGSLPLFCLESILDLEVLETSNVIEKHLRSFSCFCNKISQEKKGKRKGFFEFTVQGQNVKEIQAARAWKNGTLTNRKQRELSTSDVSPFHTVQKPSRGNGAVLFSEGLSTSVNVINIIPHTHAGAKIIPHRQAGTELRFSRRCTVRTIRRSFQILPSWHLTLMIASDFIHNPVQVNSKLLENLIVFRFSHGF